jgi:pectate lyase
MKRTLLAAGTGVYTLFCGCVLVLCLCVSSNVFAAADGWASMGGGTTGGEGGTVVEVNNAADLIYYVQGTKQTPYIIYVNGNIDLGGTNIRVRGNKTIIGRPGSHITGNLKSYRAEEGNNIFRFLNIHNPGGAGDGDCLSIDGASHIWIDHCTFTDGGDGNVDIKNGADYVTVSWCIFEYTFDSGHNFSNLVGHDDGNGGTDMNHLLVTFHHNWYSTLCKERMPSVRFGKAHIYNSYFNSPGNNYCIRTRLYAQCLVENNYYKDVQNPWQRYVTSAGGDPGLLHASGNILDNVTWVVGSDSQAVLIDGNDTVFTPPYLYTLDNAQDVPAIVQYGAGADGNDGYPPHWYFGYYGDFDRSGIVDMNDLATFTGYWLKTSGIADADYYADGIVNFREFALLASNWKYIPPIPPDTTPPAVPTGLGAAAGDATVSLDWNDNIESDLAGYNIYRSTTSGSGYTKLNGSLLNSSDYTDNSVTNETTYYYVITAADTNANESAHSSEVSAMPSAGSSSVTIQESTAGFCSVDGAVESEYSGWTGIGYANTTNASGKGINYSINILTAGTYTFTWRYALVSGSRPGNLIINDVNVVSGINFQSTGSWSTWSDANSGPVTLTSGVKTIRIQATTSGGLANIDYMNAAGESLMPASCP